MKKLFYTILIAGLISVLLLVSYSNSKMSELPPFTDTVTVFIPKNSSVDNIVSNFNRYSLLEPKWLFVNYIKLNLKFGNKSIFAGNYDVFPNTSNEEIVDKLFEGGYAKTITVTIPEGLSNKETAELFAQKLGLSEKRFLHISKSDSLLKVWGIDANSTIGYLLPETYEFYGDETEEIVINKLLSHQFSFWTEERLLELKNSGLTKHKLLTIASIVQAETPLESELPRVAGLYLNRVKLGMLLQADPTVQFALGEKKRLLNNDLLFDSPYNTYKYAGIPPGPINNPGKSAIEACLNPENHKLLYMVAVGDGSGAHNFAKDNRTHSQNVAKYRHNRRNNDY